MSDLIGIVGASGTGKSVSVEGLNPDQTYLINVAGKSLPFKGWKNKYNADKKNYTSTSQWDMIVKLLKGINDKRPDITSIVLDDAQYIMGFEFMDRAQEKGYDKFSEISSHINEILKTARGLRDDLKIYMLWHPEVSDTGELKMKTAGKMIDNHITIEGLFTVILYTHVEIGKDKTEYRFATNHTKKYPAKSPMGMFEEYMIPNDLKFVSEKIDEYYEGD